MYLLAIFGITRDKPTSLHSLHSVLGEVSAYDRPEGRPIEEKCVLVASFKRLGRICLCNLTYHAIANTTGSSYLPIIEGRTQG